MTAFIRQYSTCQSHHTGQGVRLLIILAKVYTWSTVRKLVNTSDQQTLAITRSASWLNKKIVFLQLKNYAMENPHFKDEYKK